MLRRAGSMQTVFDLRTAVRKVSLVLRPARLLALFLCCGAGLLAFGAVVASANSWVVEKNGGHYLKNGEGEVIKGWSPKEWEVWRKEVQSVAECIGIAEGCAAKEIAGETPVENDPKTTAEDAQAGIESERRAAVPLSEFHVILDNAGKEAGTLLSDLGFETIKYAKLMNATAGVELGNGLEQLYQVPEKRPFNSEAEEKEVEATHGEGHEAVGSPLNTSFKVEQCLNLHDHGSPEGCEEEKVLKEYHLGTYFLSWGPHGGSLTFGQKEEVERCKHGSIEEGTCEGREREVHSSTEGWYIPPGWERFEALMSEEFIGGELIRSTDVFVSQAVHECGAPPAGYECFLSGLPAPGRITPEVESGNRLTGLPSRPTETLPVTLPTLPPSSLNESDLKAISENGARGNIESLFPEKSHEIQEAEEKEGELLRPKQPR